MGYEIFGGDNAAFEKKLFTRLKSGYPNVLHKGKTTNPGRSHSAKTGKGAYPRHVA